MPHSSGGGHSSHGSHGGSRSSKSSMRFGNRYYRGARRYVYYRNGIPQYYYSDRPYTVQAAKSARIREIIRNILSIVFGIIFGMSGFSSFPHKVTLDYNTEIIISDSARLLSETEEEEMKNAFLAFQDKTGVTPAFFTINNKELEKQGGNLHNYAYKLYVNTFDDEKHWLVVYSTHNDRSRWEWEGMIGDDCESIISTDLENEFTKRLQKNLESNSGNLSASVIDAFETIGNKSGKMPVSKILWMAFGILIGAYVIFLAIKKFIALKNKNIEEDPRLNSVECPAAETEPETAKCQYCGGEFVVGLHTTCPHCGAPIEKWD